MSLADKVLYLYRKLAGKYADRSYLASKRYIRFYENQKLDAHSVLMECSEGRDLSGNILEICRHLASTSDFADFKLYLGTAEDAISDIREKLKTYDLENVIPVVIGSELYYRLTASCKYLFNDTGFGPFFMKKEGQIYTHTGFTDPALRLGRNDPDRCNSLGNIQKNLVCADYLIFSDESSRDTVIREYMLQNLACGCSILADESQNGLLCRMILLEESTELKPQPIPNNGKENVLLFVGDLSGNGITTSLRNLLRSVDLDQRNYIITYFANSSPEYSANIHTFPQKVSFFTITGEPNGTLSDLLPRILFQKKILKAPGYMLLQRRRIRQEFNRCYGFAHFDHVIQFSGYGADPILMFSTFQGNKTIYVHNDMIHEIKTRGNQRADVLRYAYRCYDHVAAVTEDVIAPTLALSGNESNIRVVNNIIDHLAIVEKAQLPIELDPATRISSTLDHLNSILASPGKTYINVGRFSPEKGHRRLITAFAKHCKDHPQDSLIIMGGNSFRNGFSDLRNFVAEMGLQEQVVLLEQVTNPYPIIKACDYFILSSFYEGFGLVLVEADILGLPVVSTDIVGPRGFMNTYGGALVANSEEGIYEGLRLLRSGTLTTLPIDYDRYNRQALSQFEALLSPLNTFASLS